MTAGRARCTARERHGVGERYCAGAGHRERADARVGAEQGHQAPARQARPQEITSVTTKGYDEWCSARLTPHPIEPPHYLWFTVPHGCRITMQDALETN